MAATEDADQKAEIQDAKTVAERHGPQFIPKLRGKKLNIRLYNSYEILVQTAKGQILVFKHAIATIEIVDEPKGVRAL